MGVTSTRQILKEFDLLELNDDVSIDESKYDDVCQYWSDEKTSARLLKDINGKYAEEVFFLFEIFAGHEPKASKKLVKSVLKNTKVPSSLVERILRSEDEDLNSLKTIDSVVYHQVYFAKHFGLTDDELAKIFQKHEDFLSDLEAAAKKSGNKTKHFLLKSKFFQWLFKVFHVELPPDYSIKELKTFKTDSAKSSEADSAEPFDSEIDDKEKESNTTSFNSQVEDDSDESSNSEESHHSSTEESKIKGFSKLYVKTLDDEANNLTSRSKTLLSFLDEFNESQRVDEATGAGESESVSEEAIKSLLNKYVEIISLDYGKNSDSITEDSEIRVDSNSGSSPSSSFQSILEEIIEDETGKNDLEVSKIIEELMDVLPLDGESAEQESKSENSGVSSSASESDELPSGLPSPIEKVSENSDEGFISPNWSNGAKFDADGSEKTQKPARSLSTGDLYKSKTNFFDESRKLSRTQSNTTLGGVDLEEVSRILTEEKSKEPKGLGGFLNLPDYGDRTPPNEQSGAFLKLKAYGDSTPPNGIADHSSLHISQGPPN